MIPRTDFRQQAQSLPSKITLSYQACNSNQCLRPVTITKETDLALLEPATLVSASPAQVEQAAPAGDEATDPIQRYGYLVGLLIVLLGGLALNLTPCVYPLIGVTIAYFGNQSDGDTRKTAVLAALYVLGIALTFAVVGVAVALSGGIFGAALANPYVLVAISAVLLALAASSFGWFNFRVPQWMTQKAGVARPGYAGSLLMGAGMGVVAAPCIGPIVVGLLLVVERSRNPVFGFILFFTLAVGLGLPYLVLAMVAGSVKKLPRSGEWLSWVEQLFGFVLIGLALYFLDPVIPNRVITRSLPYYAIAVGVYLGFFASAGRGIPFFQTFKLVVGSLSVLAFIHAMVPHGAAPQLAFQPFDDGVLKTAQAARRPVLIDFSADWCIPCREMENTTFTDPGVVKEASRFVKLRADLTRQDSKSESIISQFQVQGVPTLMLLDSGGRVRKKMVGYIGREEFLSSLHETD
jgi:thiol:disulfide interchange protein DsbD